MNVHVNQTIFKSAGSTTSAYLAYIKPSLYYHLLEKLFDLLEENGVQSVIKPAAKFSYQSQKGFPLSIKVATIGTILFLKQQFCRSYRFCLFFIITQKLSSKTTLFDFLFAIFSFFAEKLFHIDAFEGKTLRFAKKSSCF